MICVLIGVLAGSSFFFLSSSFLYFYFILYRFNDNVRYTRIRKRKKEKDHLRRILLYFFRFGIIITLRVASNCNPDEINAGRIVIRSTYEEYIFQKKKKKLYNIINLLREILTFNTFNCHFNRKLKFYVFGFVLFQVSTFVWW